MNETLHLLLIDDDADDRQFFTEAVEEINPRISCSLFADGASGLAYLRNSDNKLPDYIFLDMRLAGLDSRSVLKHIKAISHLQHIPVMIFTTSNQVKDAEEMVRLGATHFTTKPVNRKELYYVLSVVLESQW